jgi:hypothetical protein
MTIVTFSVYRLPKNSITPILTFRKLGQKDAIAQVEACNQRDDEHHFMVTDAVEVQS